MGVSRMLTESDRKGQRKEEGFSRPVGIFLLRFPDLV